MMMHSLHHICLLVICWAALSSCRPHKDEVPRPRHWSRDEARSTVKNCPCNHKYKDTSPLPDVFESNVLPTEQCCLTSISNGYLATVIYSDTIYVNGVYNGRRGKSHRARIPSTAAVKIVFPPDVVPKKESYLLDVKNATFHRKIILDGAEIDQRLYAHQSLSYLLVNEIVINRTACTHNPITLKLVNNTGNKSQDFFFQEGPLYQGTRMMNGKTVVTETVDSSTIPIAVNWTVIPDTITLYPNQNLKTWTFLTAIGPDSNIASAFHELGSELAAAGTLYSTHCDAWYDKWKSGHIDIDNVTISKAIYGSMYYILSSLPSLNYDTQEFPFHYYGLGPTGMAHGHWGENYEGHIYWDQEIWMSPTILMLHPKLARAILESRTYHLDAAKELAKSNGYKGAKYPWEMGHTGAEVTVAEIYSLQEIHVNGDIPFAVQQYLYMTKDVDFLKNRRGFEMISEIAKYWASRATYNSKMGYYEIHGVKPPDEFYSNVSNDVFTNAGAQVGLRLPSYAAKFVNASVPTEWSTIADKIHIPYDATLNYHPEFTGYRLGSRVKLADVILLGFPLNHPMDIDTRIMDLKLYEPATVTVGPCMTWTMFSIGYAELGDYDKQDEMFQRTFANSQAPYRVFTETATGGGAFNFMTGMGGFLQAILFGYGGFRIRQDYLLFDFNLPGGSTRFAVTGLDYLGSELDFVATEKTVSVTMTSHKEGAPNLKITTVEGDVHYLIIGKTVVLDRISWVAIRAIP